MKSNSITILNTIVFLFALTTTTSYAQTKNSYGQWIPINDTGLFKTSHLSTTISKENIVIEGINEKGPIGAQFNFNETLKNKEYTIQISTNARRSSFIKFLIEAYTIINGKEVLLSKSSNTITLIPSKAPFNKTTLSFKPSKIQIGSPLFLRISRTSNFEKSRVFEITEAAINKKSFIQLDKDTYPKLPVEIEVEIPSQEQINQMNSIFDILSNKILSEDQLISKKELENLYNDFKKVQFAGNFKPWKSAGSVLAFAVYLRYNPNDITNQKRAIEIINSVTKNYIQERIKTDKAGHYTKDFFYGSLFLRNLLDQQSKDRLDYTLFSNFGGSHFFSDDVYTIGSYPSGFINLDDFGNLSEIILLYGVSLEDDTTRLKLTKGFKRYCERFLSYSPGVADGIKPDGSTFHHGAALNNYTYNWNRPMRAINALSNTSFMISKESYMAFRKAIYTQTFLAFDEFEALSMSGRHPTNIARQSAIVSKPSKKNSITTKEITEAKSPIKEQFTTSFNQGLTGFTQFNHHVAGVYRNEQWMAVAKGQTNWSFGAEIIKTRNRNYNLYGRYQSYGSLEIIYPGKEIGNGFDSNGWNWNYNPGTTSIVLPWNLLEAETSHQKERQENNFAGSLAFRNKEHGIFTNTHGDIGLFAIDFKESIYNSAKKKTKKEEEEISNHNSSFTFKKSAFFFKDYILCLGSDINLENSPGTPVVTTLFQRLDNNKKITTNNGSLKSTNKSSFLSYTKKKNNWVIDTYNTGFYILKNSGKLTIKIENTPIPGQNNNKKFNQKEYAIGYLNHGIEPNDNGYEYVIKPNTSQEKMKAFDYEMSHNKPYIIHHKKEVHVVENKKDTTVAISAFKPFNKFSKKIIVTAVDKACLLMYQTDLKSSLITMSVVNPDLGYTFQSTQAGSTSIIHITIKGTWKLVRPITNVKVSPDTVSEQTKIQVTLKEGLAIDLDLKKMI